MNRGYTVEHISWYDPQGANPALEWETEFYSIDVTENIAAVKLRLECQEMRYIDYFNMMKIDLRPQQFGWILLQAGLRSPVQRDSGTP